MTRSDIPAGAHVAYRQQYRCCGKSSCSRCAPGRPGHGPYWYGSWKAGGRQHSCYLGKQLPAEAAARGDDARGAAGHARRVAPVEPLRVRTLGCFAVWRGATPISPEAWRSRRAAALFTCLLSAPGHSLQREQAIELLWPEAEPVAGAANLRTTIHLLRQVLDGPDAAASFLRADRDTLMLAPAGDAAPADDWLDATAFQRAAEAALTGHDAAACRAALAWYGGDYLPDDPYEAWAAPVREALRRQYLLLLPHLAGLCAARGDLEEAETHLRRVLAAEPGHEEAAATLMGLLAAAGRRHDALRVYQALATVLEEELEVAPAAEIAALRARLLAQEAAAPAARPPPRQGQPARRTNLLLALTSFVGRQWEMTQITEALAAARLVTLTGPGGCGKTRLALQVADLLVDTYPDGVWLVELAALEGARSGGAPLVPRAVAGALGLRAQPGRPVLDTLREFLHPRHLLLLLDNCEHLIDACADLVASLLQTAPRLRILATSREGLEVPGERTYPVPPLTVPDPEYLPPPERLRSYEAVQLFLERAQARRPEMALTGATAAAVAQICARLDGLPLAIELAAARVGALPVEAIATRLDNPLRLLTGGPRTALPRQQTLRATLDWSYTLLGEPERALLRRLSVFAGGWTLAAAEAVCSGGAVAAEAMLDLLAGLIHKSLVQVVQTQVMVSDMQARVPLEAAHPTAARGTRLRVALPSDRSRRPHPPMHTTRPQSPVRCHDTAGSGHDKGHVHGGRPHPAAEARYRLLETVRQYAQEQLAAAGELETVRDQHLDWCVALGERAEPHLRSAEQPAWLDRLEAEHDNLRAALQWSTGRPARATAGLQLAGAIWRLWSLRGYPYQGRHWLEETLARASSAPPALRARALLGAAELAGMQGDTARARAYGEDSLACYRALGDTAVCSRVLTALGWVENGTSIERIQTLGTESLALAREAGAPDAIAAALHLLGNLAIGQCNLAHAHAYLEESVALGRGLGDPVVLADALVDLGQVAMLQGHYERAEALFAEALSRQRALGYSSGLAPALNYRGTAAFCRGDTARAVAALEESMVLCRDLGDKQQLAQALEAAGRIAWHQGETARATALLEEGLSLARDLEDWAFVATILTTLGHIALGRGDQAHAVALHRQCLTIYRDTGVPIGSMAGLEGMALALGAQGQMAQAARLLGAAGAARERFSMPLPPPDRAVYDQSLAAIRGALGEEAWAAAWEAGRATALAAAIAQVL